MTFYYTARATYDKDYNQDGISWNRYIEWSRLEQLQELVSVDGSLNELLVAHTSDNKEDPKYIVVDQFYQTGFYTSLDYVLKNMQQKQTFNLLAVVVNPEQDCQNVLLQDFEFVGYDLLDYSYDISALSNCGGFDETFLPSDLNQYGLLNDYQKAHNVKVKLLQNNPDEHHADTNVIAIWRHTAIGRTKPNR